jgi:uncharacterized protein (TIGR00251 family)
MTVESRRIRHHAPAQRFTLKLHVQPAARRSGIVGRHGDALKVRVTAPAADNKANAALIELLSASLGIPRSAVVIRHGATSRRKLVEITGGPELAASLEKLLRPENP